MNHASEQHPPRERLLEFGLGKLDEGDAKNVEAHISQCDSCCETLLNLQDDTFVNLVRRSDGGDTQSDEPANPSVLETEPTRIEPTVGWGEESADGGAALPRELAEHPRYRIVELIGRGGMGDVYKAHHKVMNRPVALKVIKPELVRKPDAVRRFQREVQAAARLHHPNIVTAHDAEQAGDLHFLVMEFVDGVNLDEVVKRRGPLPVDEACDCIRQAAEGIEHAHQLGMVHRDIKPHNLMLTGSGEVKILDFGLANFASEIAAEEANESTVSDTAGDDARTHQLTQAGTMMGTPDYVAPEQAADARTADIRSDIYSLGCTFFMLLTGRAPFGGDSIVEKIQAHTEQDVPPLAEFRDDVPAEVEAILRKMTVKDPAQRYESPAEIAAALKDFAGDTPSPATSTKPVPREKLRSRMDRFGIATAVLTVGCLLLTYAGVSLPAVAVTWFIGVCIGWGASSWMTLQLPRRGLSLFGGLAWTATVVLAGITLYIQTDKGTVRVEINDPRIKVTFAGETLTFKNDGREITVKPGDHTLHIQRGDLTFETKQFTLGRGENPKLIVERTQRQIVVKQGERELGNWALPEPKPPVRAVLRLQAGGPNLKLLLDDKEFVRVTDVITDLKRRAAANPQFQLHITGDANIEDRDVREVMQLISTTGIRRMTFGGNIERQMQAISNRAREKNNLKQIGIGLHQYLSQHGRFPPAPGAPSRNFDKQGRPHLSWRVHLLPYIEEEKLYRRFRLDEPWNSKHNIKLLDKMPKLFKTGDDGSKTSLLTVVGKGTAYEGKAGLSIREFRDGTSTTVYLVLAGADKAIPWTKPVDLPFDREDPARMLGKLQGDEFLVWFVSGKVDMIRTDLTPQSLRALFTRNAKDKFDPNAKRK